MFFQQCKWVRGNPYKVVVNTFEKEKNTKEVIRSRYDPRTIRQNTIDGATQTIQKICALVLYYCFTFNSNKLTSVVWSLAKTISFFK
jgi:hypothetical protein